MHLGAIRLHHPTIHVYCGTIQLVSARQSPEPARQRPTAATHPGDPGSRTSARNPPGSSPAVEKLHHPKGCDLNRGQLTGRSVEGHAPEARNEGPLVSRKDLKRTVDLDIPFDAVRATGKSTQLHDRGPTLNKNWISQAKSELAEIGPELFTARDYRRGPSSTSYFSSSSRR